MRRQERMRAGVMPGMASSSANPSVSQAGGNVHPVSANPTGQSTSSQLGDAAVQAVQCTVCNTPLEWCCCGGVSSQQRPTGNRRDRKARRHNMVAIDAPCQDSD
eukprot:1971012-Karenia_brevis.AAC.1